MPIIERYKIIRKLDCIKWKRFWMYALWMLIIIRYIKPLENWDVSNRNDFGCMFDEYSSLSDIKPLENWNI